MKKFAFIVLLATLLLAACNAPPAPGSSPVFPTPQGTEAPKEAVVNLVTATTSAVDSPTEAAPPQATATAGTGEAEPAPTDGTEEPRAGSLPAWIAYIGQDGNVWLLDPDGGTMEQLTFDGLPVGAAADPQADMVQYTQPKWSSSGRMLAFERLHGTPVDEGFQFQNNLVVYDLETTEMRAVLQNMDVAGFNWQPGTHYIAYGMMVDPNYFTSRTGVDSQYSKGIWLVDAGSGEVVELVTPENNYHLVNPQFAPGSDIVSFDEVQYMEGRGNFAYFDLSTGEYKSWEKPIGFYQWSEGGKFLFYDYLTYTPSGGERIYMNTRDGSSERQVTPADMPENHIAYMPALSPDGTQAAYITEQMKEEGQTVSNVYVQPVDGGAPRDLGSFEQPGSVAWSADGQSLVLSSGPYEARQVVVISLADGSRRALVYGNWPSPRP